MKDIIDDLRKKKNMIEEKKNELAQLEGQKKEILRSLKRNFNIGSIDEAKRKLSDMQREYQSLSKEIEDEYKVLNDMYHW